MVVKRAEPLKWGLRQCIFFSPCPIPTPPETNLEDLEGSPNIFLLTSKGGTSQPKTNDCCLQLALNEPAGMRGHYCHN